MIKAILFDFSRVLLNPLYSHTGSLNELHKKLSQNADYKLLDHFGFNIELLDFANRHKEKYGMYIFTTGYIHDEPELKQKLDKIFKKVFTVSNLDISKRDPKAYKVIAQEINEDPGKILFIDDTLGNIEAAEKAGLRVIHFQSNEQLFEELRNYEI